MKSLGEKKKKKKKILVEPCRKKEAEEKRKGKKERKGKFTFPNNINYSRGYHRKKGKENAPLKMAARNATLWEARINMTDTAFKQNR